MTTWQELDAILGNRNRKMVPSVRATQIIRRSATVIAIRYHETDVVRVHQDGTYELNTAGFRTVTTKARINQYSPARVYRSKHVWYVDDAQGNFVGKFEDGMRVDSEGRAL